MATFRGISTLVLLLFFPLFTEAQWRYVNPAGTFLKTIDGGTAGPNDLCFINSQKGFAVSWCGQLLTTDNGGGTAV